VAREFLNTSDYLLARGKADDVALGDGRTEWTYADLSAAAGRLAAGLLALGLPEGSRVGLVGENSPFWVAAYLATMKTNLVAVPFSDKLTVGDVGRNAAGVGCSAVFMDSRSARRVASAFGDGVTVIAEDALRSSRDPVWPDAGTDPDADAVLMFTSGSTARPRAVRVTHRNLQANTDSIVSYLQLRQDDRVLVILPFSYCFGASLLHTHLRVGAGLVMCRSFAFPEAAVDLLDRQRCTVFAGVPSSFQLLLRASSFATRSLPSLRIIQQAGGKLPPVLVEELLAAQPDARVFVMYGQTEATARLSYLPPERLRDKLGSVGRGIPGVELRVIDDAGRPVAPGQRGEIYAIGDNISPGYYRDTEGSASKFTDRGLRTGDLAVIDEEGFIFIVDRREDFIKSWGHRIAGQEVEACALQMPQLVSAAAIGVPDDDAGEAVTLVVTVRGDAAVQEADVLAHCRTHLAKHMVPRSVFVVDGMPVNANGKIDKPALREMFAQGGGPDEKAPVRGFP
jgi:long-chain acyl-CoA synthetase